MSTDGPLVLITTLAEYQTKFWLEVGLKAAEQGLATAFLSFDDRSTEMLKKAGLRVFSTRGLPSELVETDTQAFCERYDITDLNKWLVHERYCFGLGSGQVLVRKLITCTLAAEQAIESLLREHRKLVVLQEVGGFLSVIGTFFAARRNRIDNWFIEPSFFKGGLLFTPNTFSAPRVPPATGDVEPSVQMLQYLQAASSSGTVVIPRKDAHHYSGAFTKVFNLRNLRRLGEKLIDKYVLGKKQEFGHIGWHVLSHLRMIANSRRMRKLAVSLEAVERFVYYPLHVPADMALTLRAATYIDQLALIETIARSVPVGVNVAIKEHPAMVGAIDSRRVSELLARFDHLRVIDATTNNYAVLRKASVVVTVNSKSGAEAALVGTPVIALGDAFYQDAGFVQKLVYPEDLGDAIKAAISQGPRALARNDHVWFETLWRMTAQGELYVDEKANVSQFIAGFRRFLEV